MTELPTTDWIAAGRRLRAARALTGMHQAALADRLGVSVASISDWERGRRFPPSDRIAALCAALHITPNDVFGAIPCPTSSTANSAT